jgi:hypothetical protein
MEYIMNWVLTLFFFNEQNACINLADKTIWNATGEKDFRTYMNTCGQQCIGNYDCTTTCVQKIEGYSNNCSSCFGNMGECSVKNCFMKCMRGDTPDCEKCIASSCDNVFHLCSGLVVPPPNLF